jgi:hypothetical protein
MLINVVKYISNQKLSSQYHKFGVSGRGVESLKLILKRKSYEQSRQPEKVEQSMTNKTEPFK